MDVPPIPLAGPELAAEAAWIRRLASRLVRDAAAADDLVQETLLAALESGGRIRKGLRPWLAGVLRKRIAMAARSSQRRRARERDAASEEALPSSADLLERTETHRRLAEALGELREPYRTVLLLHFYEDLSPGEIARRQGLPGSTVRSHLRRGLVELRENLDRLHGGERRAWGLALVPLAVGPERSGPGPRPLPPRWTIMHTTCALITATLVALVATLVPGPSPALTGSAPGEALSADAEPGPGAPVAGARSPIAAPGAASASRPASSGEVVRGTVRDRATGEPLAGYAVRLARAEAPKETEVAWTDAEGAFRTAKVYEAGRLVVELLDHPDLDGLAHSGTQVLAGRPGLMLSMNHDPAGKPLELKATVGPSYDLRLEAPFDPADVELEATLRAVEEEPWGPLSPAWCIRAPVRTEGGTWTRFQPLLGVLPEDRPWILRVTSEDGLWSGSARVEGTGEEPITIRLEATARLELRVTLPTGAREAVAVLVDVADASERTMTGEDTNERPDGRRELVFELGGIPAGDHAIEVRHGGAATACGIVRLVAGETFAHSADLDAPIGAGTVLGELRSASGDFDERVWLLLTDGTNELTLEPRWERRGGERVAPFEFTNVPPGAWEIVVLELAARHRWEGLGQTVHPPANGLVLRCLDTEPSRRVKIVVLDDVTEEPIALAETGLTAAGCSRGMVATGTPTYRDHGRVPLDAQLDWSAWAPGYAPFFGEASDLVRQGEWLVGTARLRHGWGARIRAIELVEGELRPLARVEVRCDGELVGRTGADGWIEVIRGAEPGRVDVQKSGWKFAGGPWDPTEGQLTSEEPTCALRFARK